MDTKRHIALPDDLWTQTKVQAAIEGVGARIIVIRSLRDYLDAAAESRATGAIVEPVVMSVVDKPLHPSWTIKPVEPSTFGASHPAPKPARKR